MFDNEGYNKKATGFIDTESSWQATLKEQESSSISDLAFPHETKNNNDFGSSFLYLDFRVNQQGNRWRRFSFCCVSILNICNQQASAQWFEDNRDRAEALMARRTGTGRRAKRMPIFTTTLKTV